MGIVAVAALAAGAEGPPNAPITATRARTNSAARQQIVLFGRPQFERYITVFDIARFAQALAEREHCILGASPATKDPDHRKRTLLPVRHQRPRSHPAKCRDELAPSHSDPPREVRVG
jgi:hypothetical protein